MTACTGSNVAFEPGLDLDAAQRRVQDRVNSALPTLPDSVKLAGVTVKRSSTKTRTPIDFAIYGPDVEDEKLRQLAKRLVDRLRESKKLGDIAAPDLTLVRRLWLDMDRTKALAAGVVVSDIYRALQAGLGGPETKDQGSFGRSSQLKVQVGDSQRKLAADIAKLKVRNAKGQMVPLSSFVTVRETMAPPVLDRFDLWPMVEITANPAPWRSSSSSPHAMREAGRGGLQGTAGAEGVPVGLAVGITPRESAHFRVTGFRP